MIATDASEAQIKQAVEQKNIEYRVATAESSFLDKHSVDLITVAQAFHWFDRDKFFSEVQRVLKPHSVLAVWSYNLLSINPDIDNIIHQLYAVTLDRYWQPERKLVENNYRGIHFPGKKIPSPVFQMTTNWNLEQLLGYLNTWSAVKAYERHHQLNPVEQIVDQFVMNWGKASQIKSITWPLNLHLYRI